MRSIRDLLSREGNPRVGEEFYQLWREYEAGETEEARAVKDIDKVEMIVQALEYEKGSNNGFDEMREGTANSYRCRFIRSRKEAGSVL